MARSLPAADAKHGLSVGIVRCARSTRSIFPRIPPATAHSCLGVLAEGRRRAFHVRQRQAHRRVVASVSQNSTQPSRGPFIAIEEPTEPRPTANASPGWPVPVTMSALSNS